MITNDNNDFQMRNAKNETILLNTHGATLFQANYALPTCIE